VRSVLNPIAKSPKAVIFDVDGTLVDSNVLHAQAWQKAFAVYGKDIPLPSILRQIGKGGDQLMPEFLSPEELDRFGEDLEKRRAALFRRDYLPRVRTLPRVRELFERIRGDGLRIALASSAQDDEIAHHIDALSIRDLIEFATSADEVRRSKPCPDVFDTALKRLAPVSNLEAIVVGDTPYDAQAADKAGLRTIGVLSGGFSEQTLRGAGAIGIYMDVSDLLAQYDTSPLASGARALHQ